LNYRLGRKSAGASLKSRRKRCNDDEIVWCDPKSTSVKSSVKWIWAEEQIAEGAAQQVGDPPLCQVVRPVIDQVTALAKASQVS
jgi:hypothetical protein